MNFWTSSNFLCSCSSSWLEKTSIPRFRAVSNLSFKIFGDGEQKSRHELKILRKFCFRFETQFPARTLHWYSSTLPVALFIYLSVSGATTAFQRCWNLLMASSATGSASIIGVVGIARFSLARMPWDLPPSPKLIPSNHMQGHSHHSLQNLLHS